MTANNSGLEMINHEYQILYRCTIPLCSRRWITRGTIYCVCVCASIFVFFLGMRPVYFCAFISQISKQNKQKKTFLPDHNNNAEEAKIFFLKSISLYLLFMCKISTQLLFQNNSCAILVLTYYGLEHISIIPSFSWSKQILYSSTRTRSVCSVSPHSTLYLTILSTQNNEPNSRTERM